MSQDFKRTPTNKVVRSPKRGHYDRKTLFEILDAHFLCHASYIFQNTALTIPTAYGRKGNTVFLHGAKKNRSLTSMLEAENVSVTVTHIDGLVLARSVFHHSMNYRSAVIFGKARVLTDDQEKMEALEIITENIVPGRWNEARLPNEKEMKATIVIAIDIEEASSKIRVGDPSDEPEDYSLNVWAGVIPLELNEKKFVPDPAMDESIDIPDSVLKYKF